MAIEAGVLCYYLDPEHSWTLGTVQSWDGKNGSCLAKTAHAKAVGKLTEDKIFVAREDCVDEDVQDLLNLTLLHDATILACLRTRYFKDHIYTNIGAIVIAINPFNFKIPWYMDSEMPKYLAEGDSIDNNIPHSWAQAHNTYWQMVNESCNQTILVSGESGAGKTEASKIVFKYLAQLSALHCTDDEKQAGLEVGTKINKTSPMLEAFGNAKTVRNDNSSRFGKFMKVKFSAANLLVGAHFTKYLLEKSRVVGAMPNERLYHSFYLLCRDEQRSAYGIGEDRDFRSLNSGHTLHNKDYDTPEEYQEVCEAMLTVGIAAEEVDSTWRLVAGVMHMLNVGFEGDTLEGGAEGSKFSPGASQHLDAAVQNFVVSGEAVERELLTTQMDLAGEVVVKTLKPFAAQDGRDALCKALYDEQFGCLFTAANALLDVDAEGSWIGLLDIFGFEDFEVNTFEQLCINLANEQLQYHYNHFIFTKDMDECKSEGVDVAAVEFPDNTPCLQMIMGKGGILALLDEQCMMGSGSDESFLDAIERDHKKNTFFEKKILAKSSFIVHHYAGDVSYEVAGFLEKNRDTLKDAWKLTFRSSSDPHIAGILPAPAEQSGPKVTVGGYFKGQLEELMALINSTNPHWIRCVKPHPAKRPKMMCGVQTMKQLASAGVLGTVKIRKAGFPVRVRFRDFRCRYAVILPDAGADAADDRGAAQAIAAAAECDPLLCQLGTTRVFMKSEVYVHLEQLKKQRLAVRAVVAQAAALGVAAARAVQRAAYGHVIDQLRAHVRRKIALRALETAKRAEVDREEADAAAELGAAISRRVARGHAAEQRRFMCETEEGLRGVLREEQLERRGMAEDLRQEQALLRRRWEQHLQRLEQLRREKELRRQQEALKRERFEQVQRDAADARRDREAAEARQRAVAEEREAARTRRIEHAQELQRGAQLRRREREEEERQRHAALLHETHEKQQWADFVATRDALDRHQRMQEKEMQERIRAASGKARVSAAAHRRLLVAEQRLCDEQTRQQLRAAERQQADLAMQEARRVEGIEQAARQRAAADERRRVERERHDGEQRQARLKHEWEQMARREVCAKRNEAFGRERQRREDQEAAGRADAELARKLELQAIDERRNAASLPLGGSTSRQRSRSRRGRGRRSGQQRSSSASASVRRIPGRLYSRLMGSERTAAAGVLNDRACRAGFDGDDAPVGIERPLASLHWRPAG